MTPDRSTGDPVGRADVLVVTSKCLYRLQAERQDHPPEAFFRADGLRHAVMGGTFDVAALGSGEVCSVRPGEKRRLAGPVPEPIQCLLILREDPLEVLIGTEEARLYRLADGELSRVESFDALDVRDQWHTPWGGPPSVRSLAKTPDGWVYADIHVGSIMRSAGSGRTWEPVTPELNEDVHQVATCPAAPDRVYANTARAVYVSEDRGASWAYRGEDLSGRYGRAIAVCPDDPDLLLATVSDGPHGDDVHGQLWRSEDAGRSWRQVHDGFPPSTVENINTHRVVFSPGADGWALAAEGLYLGRDRGTSWRRIWDLPDGEEPVMLASM